MTAVTKLLPLARHELVALSSLFAAGLVVVEPGGVEPPTS